MKKDIHPEYRPVVFEDISAGFRILTQSTIETDETTTWEDGNEYPVFRTEVSSASHPFYTGKQVLVDTAKRVDKFKAKMEKAAELSKERKGKKVKKQEQEARKDAKEEASA